MGRLRTYISELQTARHIDVGERFVDKKGEYSYYYSGLLGLTNMGDVLRDSHQYTEIPPLIAVLKDIPLNFLIGSVVRTRVATTEIVIEKQIDR
jgi:hypothetical protein